MEKKLAIESDDYNLEGDQFELALLKSGPSNKPVLAICRGVQFGQCCLRWDSPSRSGRTGKGFPFGTSHLIETKKKGSVVERLFGQASQINSVHRQSAMIFGAQLRVRPLTHATRPLKLSKQWMVIHHRACSGIQSSLVKEEKKAIRTLPYLLQELWSL